MENGAIPLRQVTHFNLDDTGISSLAGFQVNGLGLKTFGVADRLNSGWQLESDLFLTLELGEPDDFTIGDYLVLEREQWLIVNDSYVMRATEGQWHHPRRRWLAYGILQCRDLEIFGDQVWLAHDEGIAVFVDGKLEKTIGGQVSAKNNQRFREKLSFLRLIAVGWSVSTLGKVNLSRSST